MPSHTLTQRRGLSTVLTPRGLAVITIALIPMSVALLLAMTGCAGHGSARGFEPRWDKLVVQVAQFDQQQPTGVAVSRSGRVFVSFPYWNHKPRYGVAEILPSGDLKPIPADTWNDWDGKSGPSGLRSLICVQSLYIDHDDNLWVLDAGNPRQRGGLVIAGPKLFKINLSDDTIENVWYFDHKRDLQHNSYFADVRVDPTGRHAYISDMGAGAIFVVDLKTREGRLVLADEPSMNADPNVVPRIGSEQWRGYFGRVPQLGVSGLALSPDGQHLYYHALTGRTLYRIPTAKLSDKFATDAQLAAGIENLGDTGSAIDGMWMTDDGNLYMTALEKDAIVVRRSDGQLETFVADQRFQWPDSLAMGPDGYMYCTASMTHLQWPYRIEDKREMPYVVLKFSLDNVERAVRKWHEAQNAKLAALTAEHKAAQAAAQAAAEQARADARQRTAEQQTLQAQAAKRAAAKAAAAHEKMTASAQKAADEQATAAAAAAAAAELAKSTADEARLAAQDAAQAARIAQAKAKAAADKLQETHEARARQEVSQAELTAAEAAYAQSQKTAEDAARLAHAAQDLAGKRSAEAQDAATEAATALAAAELEAAKAAQAKTAADAASDAALTARQEALDAEYVEIKKRQEPRIETAAVETSAAVDPDAK